jgi:hypothetical protein
MKFLLLTILALVPSDVTARGRRRLPGDKLVRPENRRAWGYMKKASGGGLTKDDYIKDWRDGNPVVAEPTPAPAPTTPSPTVSPVVSPTASPVETPVAAPTASPVETPVADPTASPVETPVAAPTSSPVETPVADPTASPVETPVAAPTSSPVETPADPTAAPTPTALDVCDRLVSTTLREEINDFTLDLPPFDFSPGDSFLFDENPITSPGFEDGVVQGRCTVLQDVSETAPDDNLYCSITWAFPEGSIVLQGVFFEMIVIGGTGCYSDFTGIVGLENSEETDVFNYGVVAQSNPPADCPASLFGSPWFELGDEVFVDWEEDGITSFGDVIVFDANGLSTPDDDLGFTEGECIYLKTDDPDDPLNEPWCSITFVFGDNNEHTLVAQGFFNAMTITGGVGCYNGVTGTISGTVGATEGLDYALELDAADSTDNCPDGLFDDIWTEVFGDVYANYDFDIDVDSAGEAFLFEDKEITINGQALAISAGRCYYLQSVDDTYCNIVFTLDDGTIAIEGFFAEMIIVSGSGCFAGLKGTVESLFADAGFEYTWTIDAT